MVVTVKIDERISATPYILASPPEPIVAITSPSTPSGQVVTLGVFVCFNYSSLSNNDHALAIKYHLADYWPKYEIGCATFGLSIGSFPLLFVDTFILLTLASGIYECEEIKVTI